MLNSNHETHVPRNSFKAGEWQL